MSFFEADIAMNNIVVSSCETRWVKVCRYDDLFDDCGACVLVEGQQIAVFRLASSREIYALSNYDPMSGVYALSRGVVGDFKGEPMIASPIYKHRFSLKTGRCFDDSMKSTPAFRTRVEDGTVQIVL